MKNLPRAFCGVRNSRNTEAASRNGLEINSMNDRVFFDTNVLVYAFDQSEPEKRAVAKELMHRHGADGKLVLFVEFLSSDRYPRLYVNSKAD